MLKYWELDIVLFFVLDYDILGSLERTLFNTQFCEKKYPLISLGKIPSTCLENPGHITIKTSSYSYRSMQEERFQSIDLSGFRGVPSSLCVMALRSVVGRQQIFDYYMPDMHALTPLKDGEVIVGQAFTVDMDPNPKSSVTEAMTNTTRILDQVKPGEILVIAGHGKKAALWGDNMNRRSLTRKIGGVILDGYARDLDVIGKESFPVFCLGVTPLPLIQVAATNVPVECAGAKVNPSDIILADNDGVIVIPKEKASEVIKALENAKRVEEKYKEEK